MADYSKRYNFLGKMFPGQFDTIPHIIVWSIVFILDILIVFGAAYLLGIPLPVGSWAKAGLILYLAASFALFCLESWVFNKIKQ